MPGHLKKNVNQLLNYNMKKFLLAALVAALTIGISIAPSIKVAAQQTNTVASAKAITAADTITMNLVSSNIVQFQYTYTETSGTTAGKLYLEGNFLGTTWVKLDSFTLTDVGTAQTLRTLITATSYKNYRFVNTNTSSASATVTAGYLRRPDETR